MAGLLREDERKSLNGFPGAIRVPILKQLFSNNDQTIGQTDIVMLLTPHILRAPDISEADLKGKVTLVNFWGPWCPACAIEFPHLVELEEHFRGDPNFQFLSISTNADPLDDRGLRDAV